MPKINVYLPDELAAAVKTAGFAVSPVCQQALRDAVAKVARARQASALIRDPDVDLSRVPHVGERLGALMTPRLRVALRLAGESPASPTDVSTIDLLVGVLSQGDNLAVAVLRSLDVDPDELQAAAASVAIAEAPPRAFELGRTDPEGDPTLVALTEPARAAVAAALDVAIELGHNYLGCEHLLLGLVSDEQSGAGVVLRGVGVEPGATRRAVTAALAGFVQSRTQPTGVTSSQLDEVIRRLDALEHRLEAASL